VHFRRGNGKEKSGSGNGEEDEINKTNKKIGSL